MLQNLQLFISQTKAYVVSKNVVQNAVHGLKVWQM